MPSTNHPPLSPETKWLRSSLERMAAEFKKMAALAEAEIARIDRGELTAQWTELPSNLAYRLTRSLNTINSQLYTYFRSNFFDPCKLYARQQQRSVQQLISQAEQEVEIQIHSDLVAIKLPYLLPRGRTGDALLYDMLLAKLSTVHNFPKWNAWHAAFIHVFPESTARVPRDVDNYEYKRVIDLIAFSMNLSDCAYTFSAEMRTAFTDLLPPGTYIEITPKNPKSGNFPKWDMPNII